MHTHWKTEIADLRSHAAAVSAAEDPIPALSARAAARALSGAVGIVADRFGVDAMQRACAALVRSPRAWATSLGTLPTGHDGRIPDPVALIAGLARGILPMAGPDNLRAALAFWASESDSAAWRVVAGC